MANGLARIMGVWREPNGASFIHTIHFLVGGVPAEGECRKRQPSAQGGPRTWWVPCGAERPLAFSPDSPSRTKRLKRPALASKLLHLIVSYKTVRWFLMEKWIALDHFFYFV